MKDELKRIKYHTLKSIFLAKADKEIEIMLDDGNFIELQVMTFDAFYETLKDIEI